MGRRTIYVKPEKEELYSRAVKLSNDGSLSAILEEAVEALVEQKEGRFHETLLVAVLGRTVLPPIFQLLVDSAGRLFKKEAPALWNRANHVLDVLNASGVLDEANGVWLGPKAGVGKEQGLNSALWYRGIHEDLTWLDELCEIALGRQFGEYEREYKSTYQTFLKEALTERQFSEVWERLQKEGGK